jgi:hypothetical protein
MGLHLGMDVQSWPPDNIEELAKRYEDHYYYAILYSLFQGNLRRNGDASS